MEEEGGGGGRGDEEQEEEEAAIVLRRLPPSHTVYSFGDRYFFCFLSRNDETLLIITEIIKIQRITLSISKLKLSSESSQGVIQ